MSLREYDTNILSIPGSNELSCKEKGLTEVISNSELSYKEE